MKKKKMHFAQFVMHGPTYHSLAMWRHPETRRDLPWDRPELYQHIAKVCERGKLDMVFFADLSFISDAFQKSLAPALRCATQAPMHDPMPLLSWMGAVTDTIGLAATFSISHHHPFYAARVWASIDHLTRGRAAWNIVTSVNHNESNNYGEDALLEHDLRYDRAEEFMEVCKKLWNSWDEDAVRADREAGIFADPEKVHRLDHEGRFFRCRGPLTVTRSPQVGPALIQAGASPKGRAFAARHAEAIFAINHFAEGAADYYADIKNRMENEGRNPDHCKILFGVQPIIAKTETEARDKQALHNELVPDEGGLAILSSHMDYDLSKLELDDVMQPIALPGLQSMAEMYSRTAGKKLTLREVAKMHGESVSLPQFVGTSEQVADQLEAYFDTVGGDGFMLSATHSPGAIEEFVDLVIPELQKRGRFRTEYAGKTQREHLLQE